MGRGIGLVLVGLLGSTPAWAQAGKVAKAEKMLAKHEAGADGALEKAWDAIGAAKSHPSTRDDAGTWLVLARVTEAWVGEEGAPMEDPLTATLEAWDAVVGADASKAHGDAVLEAALRIGSVELAAATNAFEGDRMEDATAHLARVHKAWALVRQVGTLDASREVDALRLSTLAAVELGDAKAAVAHHDALTKAGGRRTGTTLAVAKVVARKQSDKDALAFLAPIADAHPDDAALLEARVGLLRAQQDLEGVRAVLAANQPQVGKALGITLVHARSWAELDDWTAAGAAYKTAWELDNRNQDALRGYAEAEIRRARRASASADATKKWAERKAFKAEKLAAFEHARELLQSSRELEPGHLATLKRLREVLDEVEVDDPEEVQALDQAIREAESAGGSE